MESTPHPTPTHTAQCPGVITRLVLGNKYKKLHIPWDGQSS